MAAANPTGVRPNGAAHPVIFDGDAAATSDLATHRRARITVADASAAYRAELVTAYVKATGDWQRELALLAEAARYDRAHPDEPPLADEMYGTHLQAA